MMNSTCRRKKKNAVRLKTKIFRMILKKDLAKFRTKCYLQEKITDFLKLNIPGVVIL